MIRTVLILAFASAVRLSAQQPAPDVSAPAFEVASVKVSRQVDAGIMRKPTPGRVFFQNAPLHILVEEAFGVKPYQVIGIPAWTDTERFDVTATHDPALANQVPSMLQRLLAERFGLRARREVRELPIYDLVKARPDGTLGPGLRVSTTDCVRPAGQRSPCMLQITSGVIEGTGTRWGFLPTNIGVWDRPVIDKTGLSGSYDVKLEWTPDPALARSPDPAAATAVSTADRASIFTALQEQLGLKLEPSRGPVEVLVIDSVSRPTPD